MSRPKQPPAPADEASQWAEEYHAESCKSARPFRLVDFLRGKLAARGIEACPYIHQGGPHKTSYCRLAAGTMKAEDLPQMGDDRLLPPP